MSDKNRNVPAEAATSDEHTSNTTEPIISETEERVK